MTDEKIPLWKQAVKDSKHSLHQATWLLFRESFNPKFADRQLAAKKDEVIEYMFLILDTDDLYLESAFGSGNAPINVCKLLGRWQIIAAIPRLMQIIIEEDIEAIVLSSAQLQWKKWVKQLLNLFLRHMKMRTLTI